MNARALAQVLIRCWGLVLIVSAVASAGTPLFLLEPATGSTSDSAWKISAVVGTLNVVIDFVAGVLFVRNGDRIGAWLVSDIEVSDTPADARQIEIVALTILGIYFLVVGLRQIAGVGYTFITKPTWDETHPFEYVWDQEKRILVPAVVDAVAGMILLFSRVGLAGAISKAWRVIRARDDSDG